MNPLKVIRRVAWYSKQKASEKLLMSDRWGRRYQRSGTRTLKQFDDRFESSYISYRTTRGDPRGFTPRDEHYIIRPTRTPRQKSAEDAADGAEWRGRIVGAVVKDQKATNEKMIRQNSRHGWVGKVVRHPDDRIEPTDRLVRQTDVDPADREWRRKNAGDKGTAEWAQVMNRPSTAVVQMDLDPRSLLGQTARVFKNPAFTPRVRDAAQQMPSEVLASRVTDSLAHRFARFVTRYMNPDPEVADEVLRETTERLRRGPSGSSVSSDVAKASAGSAVLAGLERERQRRTSDDRRR